jgi:hypothetical protein
LKLGYSISGGSCVVKLRWLREGKYFEFTVENNDFLKINSNSINTKSPFLV